MENKDSRLMNNTLNPEQQNSVARELATKKREENNEDDDTNNEENNTESSTLREQVMEARKKKEAGLKKESLKTGESATDELSKRASTQVLNSLWELTASWVGSIPGFLGLNILAFLKITGIDLFGVVEKIKFRLGDKIGLALLDLVVGVVILGILALFLLICNIIQNPLSYIGEVLKMLWGRVVGK
ncbi:MAG: hypothetical protein Q7T79_01890 [bacterium]|nr:hypothetical protein [bacterium]